MTRIAFFLALTLMSVPASAETIWQKAKRGKQTEERLTRQSVERVMVGTGDDHDLMRVRVGLITLSRGEVKDPRTVILLLRLRREMGLVPSALSEKLLREALKGDLTLIEKAWARLELAHLSLKEGHLVATHRHLNAAASVSWRARIRSEVLLLRGFAHLATRNETAALSDFQQVTQLPVSRRLHVQAALGAAVAHALRGDSQGVNQFTVRAFVIDSTRASVSRRDPFWDLPLTDTQLALVHTLLLWGSAEVRDRTSKGEGTRSRSQACQLLGEPPSETNYTTRTSWDSSASSALREMWTAPCGELTPAAVSSETGAADD